MRLVAVIAVLALNACGPREEAPELPPLDMSRFQPGVRAAIEPAYKIAAGSRDAASNAALARVLHAHGQYSIAPIAYRRSLATAPKDASVLYLMGAALASDGKHDLAIEALRRSLAERPSSTAARLRLADSLLASGDTAAASKEYAALPPSPQALYGLGRTQTGEEAVATLRKASEMVPRFGAARFALAAALRKLGRTEEAERALADYERDKLVAPPLDDPDMAEVEQLDVSATGLLRRAAAAERARQLEEALRLHVQASEADPKLTQVWVNLISLHARLKNFAAAEEAYRKALALEPNRAEAYYNYGVFCMETERVDEAQKAFEKTAALDAANPEAWHNLGVIAQESGDLTRAAKLFDETLARKPDHRSAHFHLGRIYANQKRYAAAITQFERAVEPLDEMSASVLYALGAVQARNRDRAKAVEYLQRARGVAMTHGQNTVLQSIERDLALLTRP
ncbi:MAG: tetratricopeptide repeat protein [Acidobacteria bacterium]|nr:tetratricopeptide repeat protein [Acidobacteriota bacterium]